MLRRLPPNPSESDLQAAYAAGMLRKEALRDQCYYRGRCRNASIAQWHEKAQCFLYLRTKFTARFLEAIRHPEDEQVFDVFMPEAHVGLTEVSPDLVLSEAQVTQFFQNHPQ